MLKCADMQLAVNSHFPTFNAIHGNVADFSGTFPKVFSKTSPKVFQRTNAKPLEKVGKPLEKVKGFEPLNVGSKFQCLTSCLHPNDCRKHLNKVQKRYCFAL